METISTESLYVVAHNGMPVITSEILAGLYATNVTNI